MKSSRSIYTTAPSQWRWNPLHWPLWAKLTGAMLLLAAIIALSVGIHEAVENSGPYPDYTPLNYTLQDAYHGESFFDKFDYFTAPDPTYGFVQYQSAAASQQRNLTHASSTSAMLRVDTADTNAAEGRASVRITSKTQYDSGLFIFDVAHAPYGCTLWPSIWLADPSRWPLHGEIDVMEAVETADQGNEVTLHTTAGCSMAVKRRETGVQEYTTCLNSTNYNDGCGVRGAKETYGAAFNAAGGGIYALELRTAGIRVWTWPRAQIPSELSSLATTATTATPDPASWGEALADFPATHCDVASHFSNQSIIANIDVCGAWAGQQKVYGGEFGCPGTCEDYARYNASGYGEAYWEINGFWVFKAV